MAPHSSTLAWKIPWMEESCLTEQLHFHFSLSCIGEGNGNLLQCSYLENPRDRGACWAAVFGRDWHDLAAAWVKIREIERLNQSKWLKPVRALGFRKKGLAFARDSSLTPKWDVNSGCSNKEEVWLQGSEKEAVLWKWAEKWKRTSAREDWCHSFLLVPHQQRTGRMDVW